MHGLGIGLHIKTVNVCDMRMVWRSMAAAPQDVFLGPCVAPICPETYAG